MLLVLAARGAGAPGAVRRGPPGARLLLGIGLLVILVHSLFYTAFFEDPLTWGLLALLAATARPGMMEPA